jgi:hypothetical protein
MLSCSCAAGSVSAHCTCFCVAVLTGHQICVTSFTWYLSLLASRLNPIISTNHYASRGGEACILCDLANVSGG